MTTLIQPLLMSFVPLFFAIDPPMAVPFFITMTEGSSRQRRLSLANEAVLAAFAVGFLFWAVGQLLFKSIGITESDFRVAGGIVLLAISVTSLVLHSPKKEAPQENPSGAVPLGIPLIMGPAAITTIVLSVRTCGYSPTLIAVALNLFLVWLCLRYSLTLVRWIGLQSIQVISKIAYLILVAIAVMMIRTGLQGA